MIRQSLTLVLLTASMAFAHGGRRFDVQIIDNQLAAQGYISTGVDDGGGIVRPYLNAIHGHWENIPGPTVAATADLPGYDVTDGLTPLIGYDLLLNVTGGWKWTTPSMMGTVTQTPLGLGEAISVTLDSITVSTDAPGALTLVSYDGTNGDDLDVLYSIGLEPSGVIFVLEGFLSTDAPGIANSGTIYTVLAPSGEGLHHAALNAESQLGLTIPEPASLLVLLALSCGLKPARR